MNMNINLPLASKDETKYFERMKTFHFLF